MAKLRQKMSDNREMGVYLLFSMLTLMAFLPFAGFGGFGPPDPCIEGDDDHANLCYCEDFDPSEVGEPGIRQPQNTFSNLYALFTGAIVVAFAQHARQNGTAMSKRMCGDRFYPLLYICVVVFLGLGSMFYHATLVKVGGVFDNLSMYTFANFILFYTLTRIVDSDALFLLGYIGTTACFTLFSALNLVSSFGLILALVVIYTMLEVYILIWMPESRAPWLSFWIYYVPALVSFGAAVTVWILSQTDEPWCWPNGFQMHGVWHLLAGVTATLLYFYWRDSRT